MSMKTFNIRKSEYDDVKEIWEIFQEAISYFHDVGINQWQYGYPNEDVIIDNIKEGNSYVVEEDGRIVGTCYIAQIIDPNYAYIEEGEWLNDEAYYVIHRIAIRNAYKGKQVADLFMKKALALASASNINNIRVDTHPENVSMQKWIARNGFEKVGVVYVGQHEKRYAYQRVLSCK